jgi:fructose-1-phosphate kinase PfkB-like protein
MIKYLDRRDKVILTIALNPAVVRTINVEGFQIDQSNEANQDALSVGDCGIYSAYIVKLLQGDPYVMGISGGIGGRYIKNFLDKNKIKTDFLQVDHETKTHLLIHDSIHDTTTKILSHNNQLTQRDFINIKHRIYHHIKETELITLTGDDSWSAEFIRDLNSMTKNSIRIITAVEGDSFTACVNERVYASVMDLDNLKALGFDFPEDVDSYERIRNFRREHKIKYLVIKGQYEIIGFAKNKICKVNYHAKDSIYPIVKSMILGGLSIGIKRNYSFETMIKLMGAIANNCSSDEYPFVIRRNEIDRGMKHSKLYEIYNQRNGYTIEGV